MKILRFLYPSVAIIALIPVYQNCAKKAASYSVDTSVKAAMMDSHLGANGNVYEIVHDSGDGYGEVAPEQLYTNIEGGDSADDDDDPASPDGNSVEPNMPDSNPKAPDTTTQNSDGSPVIPLDCSKPDNKEKECVDNPMEIPQPPPKANSTIANLKFDLERWCRGRNDKGNILESKFIAAKITSADGKTILCEQSGSDLIDEAEATASMTIKNCDITKLPDNALITLYNDLGLSIFHADDKESYAVFGVTKSKAVHSQNTKANAVKVTIANYKKHKFLPVLLKDNHRNSKKNKVDACDKYDGSPLVIDMRAYSLLNTPFYLSSPEQGKMFNILGDNGSPANSKTRISWLTDNRVMFLVLPNNGSVNGVNELFGDGTKGPDGFYADNGFKALAKYDAFKFSNKSVLQSARDGKIDKGDEVFSKLRLWFDQDLDAVVDSGELVTLSDAGVKSIDLGYDTRFHVRDQHGNHIKFKSAVEMNDGKLRPIFDIWFKLDETVQ